MLPAQCSTLNDHSVIVPPYLAGMKRWSLIHTHTQGKEGPDFEHPSTRVSEFFLFHSLDYWFIVRGYN